MPMVKQLWSINALAVETGRDRRTIAKALASVPPDGVVAGRKGWFLQTAMRALDQHGNGGPHPPGDPIIETLSDRLDAWKEIRRSRRAEISIDRMAALCNCPREDILTWLRAGLPYVSEGNWNTGDGFVLCASWTLDWYALVYRLAKYVG